RGEGDRADAGGQEVFVEAVEPVGLAAGGDVAGALGDDADVEGAVVAGDGSAEGGFLDDETGGLRGADQQVGVRGGTEGGLAARAATVVALDLLAGVLALVDDFEGEVEVAAHEAGGFGQDVAAAVELVADGEVG